MSTAPANRLTCSHCLKEFRPEQGVYIPRRGVRGSVTKRFICAGCQERRTARKPKPGGAA